MGCAYIRMRRAGVCMVQKGGVLCSDSKDLTIETLEKQYELVKRRVSNNGTYNQVPYPTPPDCPLDLSATQSIHYQTPLAPQVECTGSFRSLSVRCVCCGICSVSIELW